jgi:predicted CoA-substrate-specific enzyme activase
MMTQEYGRWPESEWTSDVIDWKKANVITAGVDVGTTGTQAAIIVDGELFGYSVIHTGVDFKKAAGLAVKKAAGMSGLAPDDIGSVAATGFGRKNVSNARKELDEIQCHGIGARFLFGPAVTTVVDLGAQTVKAIRLYQWDRIRDFKTSDKCATGFGRNIEVMANILQVPIAEIGDKSLDVEHDPEPVSTTCCNFACPETVGLFRQGYREEVYSGNEVLASYLFAIAWRALSTIGKLAPLDVGDIQLEKELAFTGGLAKNSGITKRLERELDMVALPPRHDPQIAGAIGAALLA